MAGSTQAKVVRAGRSWPTFAVAPLAALIASCGGGGGGDSGSGADLNVRPAFVRGDITTSEYDGNADDLLTGGLGKSGLQSGATAPMPANAANPTAAELRKLAIFNNYRALVDVNPNGGYGTLYGPNVDNNGGNTLGEGKIAGTEHLAYSDDGSGRDNVTMMVQVPRSFDANNPCIVLAASSGSRGVYGAIGTAGEWGLKRGCAVAYTDKGTGIGLHDLTNDTVNLKNGTRASASAAGAQSNFTAPLTAQQRQDYAAANPFRFAVKHAHSQRNPEKDWGRYGLEAIEFAFYMLNERYGDASGNGRTRKIVPANTIVIASSVSNGAGVSIAAAEQDTRGLIDGVAVGEPQIQLVGDNRVAVRRGAATLPGTGRTLYDINTLANLLQPCAALAPSVQNAPLRAGIATARAANRCTALRAANLVAGNTTDEQAADALRQLTAAGWEPGTAEFHASHYASGAVPAIVMTYSNSYGRFSVTDELCGLSFASTDTAATTGTPAAPNPNFGRPVALAPAMLASSFGTGNGIPPMSGVNIVNENALGGPIQDALSVSPSTQQQDYNFEGARCQRELFTGTSANAQRVKQGIDEVLRNGNLRGKPAVIVHGRLDTLVPPAFTSRPYVGLNRVAEGTNSKLSYIEVTNAQHFDTFITVVPGYDTRVVPMHYYFVKAMDAMYANLKSGTALPPSQVIRTTPRGGTAGSAPAITQANVPAISANPAANARITFDGNTVVIPD